ncbi:MAG TPA: MFS transporter [Verrucomicrobiae bacterium]|nr:MFS transporter [Verrucomicrobiae bacterium]
MFRTLRKAEYAELMILFFIQSAAMAIWFVPLGPILDAHRLHDIKPFAFAASAVAAFISPLAFGAMADRHVPPARVLRWLAFATGLILAVIATAVKNGWNAWLVLGLIQIFYIAYSPMFSISTALVFARLKDAKKEFGPIRSLATVGWMSGGILIGLLNLDQSAFAMYFGAVFWMLVAAFTFFLPALEVPASVQHLTWHERLGLDALTLLKDRDTRVVFLTTMLFNIPLCAFYPYAPAHLQSLGFVHTSAWMSLGQSTEIVAMFGLGWLLLHWRLKWIFTCGLAFGVARFALSAGNTKLLLLLGIALHGASFVLVSVTAQIYLDQRVDPAWRVRAQALLTLMTAGAGNLIGYLGTGWWFAACARGSQESWPWFWGGLSATMATVLVYFLTYRGRGAAPGRTLEMQNRTPETSRKIPAQILKLDT